MSMSREIRSVSLVRTSSHSSQFLPFHIQYQSIHYIRERSIHCCIARDYVDRVFFLRVLSFFLQNAKSIKAGHSSLYVYDLFYGVIFFSLFLSHFSTPLFSVCANFMLLSRVYWHRVTDRDRMCRKMCELKKCYFSENRVTFLSPRDDPSSSSAAARLNENSCWISFAWEKSWFSLTNSHFSSPLSSFSLVFSTHSKLIHCCLVQFLRFSLHPHAFSRAPQFNYKFSYWNGVSKS